MEQDKSGVGAWALRKKGENLHSAGVLDALAPTAGAGGEPNAGAVVASRAGLEEHIESRFPLRPEDTARTIEQDLWRLLKEWWGPTASVDELGLLELKAKANRRGPLEELRAAIRYVVQGGLWG